MSGGDVWPSRSTSVMTGTNLNDTDVSHPPSEETQDDEVFSSHSNYGLLHPNQSQTLSETFNEQLQLDTQGSSTDGRSHAYFDTSVFDIGTLKEEANTQWKLFRDIASQVEDHEIGSKLRRIKLILNLKHVALKKTNASTVTEWESLCNFLGRLTDLLCENLDGSQSGSSERQKLMETLDDIHNEITRSSQNSTAVYSSESSDELFPSSFATSLADVERTAFLRECNLVNEITTTSNRKRFIYKLPTTTKYVDEHLRIRQIQTLVNDDNWMMKETKVIMMAGKTGEGKSLMINRLVNYIFGVKYSDNFRLRLIAEEEERRERLPEWSSGQGRSVTSWVTGYLLCWRKEFSSTVPYNLYLIDVPGFADAEGVRRDKEIVNQISNFLHNNTTSPHFLSAIAFVVNATTTRLTEETLYVFDEVLKLYSKDFVENVFVLFSNSDEEEEPKALESIRQHRIIFNEFFKFNNSIYSDKDSKLAEAKWELGDESMRLFFTKLASIQSKDIQSTLSVLQYREALQVTLTEQESRINESMGKLTEMQQSIDTISGLKNEAIQNADFTVEYQESEVRLVPVDHTSVLCQNCNETCHSNCRCVFAGINAWSCQAFYWISGCRVCTNNCGHLSHLRLTSEYRRFVVTKTRTIEQMMRAYNIAQHNANWQVNLLRRLLTEYRNAKDRALRNIAEATDLTNRLNHIAMRNRNMTVVAYIDSLIFKEEHGENRPEKLDILRNFRTIADREEKIKSGEINANTLASQLSEREIEMQRTLYSFGITDILLF